MMKDSFFFQIEQTNTRRLTHIRAFRFTHFSTCFFFSGECTFEAMFKNCYEINAFRFHSFFLVFFLNYSILDRFPSVRFCFDFFISFLTKNIFHQSIFFSVLVTRWFIVFSLEFFLSMKKKLKKKPKRDFEFFR